MPLSVQEHVVQLQVTVDDACTTRKEAGGVKEDSEPSASVPTLAPPLHTSLVKVVESERDLSRVEPCVLLRQSPVTLHVVHEVTSVDTLNDKEQSEEGGEGREGMQ